LEECVARALDEDVGAGDLTTAAVVPVGAPAVAWIEQRQAGVIAGLDAVEEVFRQLDEAVELQPLAEEGAWRDPGQIARIEGPAASILTGERTALNLLGHLSGIATMTARYVGAIDGTGARVLDTRKTTPGLRELEKHAIRVGGGSSHRAGLYDAILVKENHSALAGGVGEAARLAVARRMDADFVEVEVETLDELDAVLDTGVDRVLLDNMSLEEVRAAVERARGKGVVLEASGGIDLDTVRAVAQTGVALISVGALTHSAPALDVALLLGL